MTSLIRQTGAILSRYWTHERRAPIRCFIAYVIWPGLWIFALLKYLSVLGYLELAEPGPIIPEQTLALLLLLILTIHVYSYVDYLVNDKMSGMKSLMFAMGLKKGAYYLAHSIGFFSTALPIVAIIGSISIIWLFNGSQASDLVIVAIYILFALHLLAIMFALTSIINSTSLPSLILIAAVCELLIHGFLEWLMKHTNDYNKSILMFAMSVDPFESLRIFADSYQICGNCNTQQVSEELGVSQPTNVLLAAMAFWTVLTFLLALWIEEVCPWQKDKVPRSALFCFRSSPRRTLSRGLSAQTINEQTSTKYFEAPQPNLKPGISIKNLTKKFGNERAVDDINFDIYNGEATLLLGHNGAGKTTLMNMILGKLRPTEGYIDVFTSKNENDPAVGVCPQTSVFDKRLTVKQHLELFAKIKSNLHGGDRARDIRTTLYDVSLEHHADFLPSELSSGMQRKLSLGMAFVGKSSILILDEPSSGLDPDSRVFIWNAIRRYRADRTVLMSTQHMEEADYLGDRIAIMNGGKIVCCGSSIFLNNRFGSGYKLRVECLASNRKDILELTRRYFSAARPSEDERVVDESVSKHELSLDMVIELIGEKSDQTAEQKDQAELSLIEMLQEIEAKSNELGIKAHGLRSSSIEDVLWNTTNLLNEDSTEDRKVNLTINTTGASQLDTVINPLIRLERERNFFVDELHLLGAFMKKHLRTYTNDWMIVLLFRVLLVIYACWYIVDDIRSALTIPIYKPSRYAYLIIFHFASYPIKEKVSKFKIMQLTTLANVYTYWLSQLLVDLLTIFVAANVLNVLLEIELHENLNSGHELFVHLVASGGIFLFGVAGALNCYVLSTFFSESKTGLAYTVIYLLVGLIVSQLLIPVIMITFKIHESIEEVQKVAEMVLVIVYPTEAFQYLLHGLVTGGYIKSLDPEPSNVDSRLFSWVDPISAGCMALAAQSIVFGLMLWVIESYNLDPSTWFGRLCDCLCCVRSKAAQCDGGISSDGQPDGDVLDERRNARRTINSERETYRLVAHDLSKSYRPGVKVVDQLSFTVGRGECFGLLGVNGAGKSTTFSMLAAERKPDSGRIWLMGSYSDSNLHAYRKKLAYTPQRNPNVCLTPVEALSFMARLRRVDEQNIPALVSCLLLVLDMSEHAYKRSDQLSGGTRRKLALGMSLIGNPEMVALDEPTAGVDPVARRAIWQLLRSLRSQKKVSIVISSHAMEECEALCDRISIMARGRLRCIGSFLHLRSKFSQACNVRVRLSPSENKHNFASNIVPALTRQLKRLAGNSVKLTDLNLNSAAFNIASTENFRRSALFKLLRDFRLVYRSLNYIVNDSSLEDIFLAMAREQQPEPAGSGDSNGQD